MNKTSKRIITAAAVSGLLAGIAISQGCSGSGDNSSVSKPAPGQAVPVANMPKVHGCSGENDCKGTGGCKTAEHDCKFKNACKGKGGCDLTDKDIKEWEKQHTAAKSASGS